MFSADTSWALCSLSSPAVCVAGVGPVGLDCARVARFLCFVCMSSFLCVLRFGLTHWETRAERQQHLSVMRRLPVCSFLRLRVSGLAVPVCILALAVSRRRLLLGLFAIAAPGFRRGVTAEREHLHHVAG